MPETVMYYKILPKINKNIWLLDDKNIFEEICRGYKIPIPTTLIKIKRGTIFNKDCEIIKNNAELNKTLSSTKSKRIFMKPADAGSGGNEIMLFLYDKSKMIFKNDKKIKLDIEYLQTLSFRDWILQEGIEQIEELKKINSSSVNTFRVLTYFSHFTGTSVLACTLRCGINKSFIDNVHGGGLHLQIDIKDGSMANIAYDGKLDTYSAHINSGYVFRNKKVKQIKQVTNLAIKCANLFPTITCIGWDITLTPDGAIVIEGNSSPALEMQITMNGMAKILLDSYNKKGYE